MPGIKGVLPSRAEGPGPGLYQRLAGAAVGCMCGDALGMPVEGWSASEIQKAFGRLDRMVEGRLPAGSYTDDSQMMLAIIDTLARHGRLDPARLSQAFLKYFEPRRGYGGRIHGVMERLRAGTAWDKAGTDSFGNGGAMRVGVLGVFYAHDQDALRAAALDQCRITHFHPQGLAGALAQATAAGIAVRLGGLGQRPDPAAVVNAVAQAVEPIDPHTAARFRAMPALGHGDEQAARRALVSEYACDVTAAEATPPALGAFLAAESFEQAVVLAVSLGGDADTIGAMTGALAGAYWGLGAVPRAWSEALEIGPRGRDHALKLCRMAANQKAVDGNAMA